MDAAIREGVDVVALAGDVVEREDDFFEAYRHLHQGVEKLVDAGISVFGVAGNHDVQVLPRLAKQIPKFGLLGADGSWEATSITAAGQDLTIWGRSFTADRMREAPLDGAAFTRRPGINLGLLHCDLDQHDSPYAPIARAALDAAGLDGWLLGHIHVPSALESPNPFGYLGSMTGLDPGESGPRGPWLLSVRNGKIDQVSQWPLAPLRWERMEVELTGIEEAGLIRERLLAAILKLDETLAAGIWGPKAVGLRVRFTGRTRWGSAPEKVFSEEDRGHLHTGSRQTHYFLERLENATRPEIPLEELARRGDPPSLLAARLLLLDQPSGTPERNKLLTEARKALEPRLRDSRWAALNPVLSDSEVEAFLRRAATAALERLLDQQRTVE